MRSPTRIPRLCACGARAVVSDLCVSCEREAYVRAARERRWSEASADDRAAVVDVLGRVSA